MAFYLHVSFLSGNGHHGVINQHEKWGLFLKCIVFYLSALNFTCQFICSLLSLHKSLYVSSQSAFILTNLNISYHQLVSSDSSLCFRSFMSIVEHRSSTDLCAILLVKFFSLDNDCLSLCSIFFILIHTFSDFFLFVLWLFSVQCSAFTRDFSRQILSTFVCLLLTLSINAKEASQEGLTCMQAILTLLKYIVFLHISMNSQLSTNDLQRAKVPLSHIHILVSWS